MTATIKRIQKELIQFSKNPIPGYSAGPMLASSPTLWVASITGPECSPFAGGTFHMTIQFPEEYPFRPPKVNFTTRIYHPNIDGDGAVCVDILKDAWTPEVTI